MLQSVGIDSLVSLLKGSSPHDVPYEGKYIIEGTRPSGTRYQGTATLSRSGDQFSLSWNIDNQTFSGSGTLSGNQLSIKWRQGSKGGGLIVYTLNPNGSLSAAWGEGKGSETLVPVR
jgi:hypothetical protein